MLGVSAWKDRFRQLAIDPDDPVATKTHWGTMLRRQVKAARASRKKEQIYASGGGANGKKNRGPIEPPRFFRARVLKSIEELKRFHRGRLLWVQPGDWTNTPERDRISTLVGIDFSCSSISDIQLVTHITELQTLNLQGCRGARGFHELSQLKNLTHLDLSHCNQLSLVHFLSELVSLRSLSLLGCLGLIDLAPVGNLTSLTTLDFGQCYQVSDLSFMAPLKDLDTVNMEGDQRFGSEVRDMSVLRSLTNLKLVNLAQMSHLTDSDLKTVAMLDQVTNLNLEGCPIRDISPLSRLLKLEVLVLQRTLVEDVSVVSKLLKLQVLLASNCPEMKGLVPDFTDLQDITEIHLRGNVGMLPIKQYEEAYLQRLEDAFEGKEGKLWLDIEFPHVTEPIINPDARFAVASYPVRGSPFLCHRLLKLAREGRISFLCVFDSEDEFGQRGKAFGDATSPHARKELFKEGQQVVAAGRPSRRGTVAYHNGIGMIDFKSADRAKSAFVDSHPVQATKMKEGCKFCQLWTDCKACYWFERWHDNMESLRSVQGERKNTVVCIDVPSDAAGPSPAGVGHRLERKHLDDSFQKVTVMSAKELLSQADRAMAWRSAVRDWNWSAAQVCTMFMAPKDDYTAEAQKIVVDRIVEFITMVYQRHYKFRKELLEGMDGGPVEMNLPICEACSQLGSKPQRTNARSPAHGHASMSRFSSHSMKDVMNLSKRLVTPEGCEELHTRIPKHPKFCCCILLLETVLTQTEGAVREPKRAEVAALTVDVAAVYAEYGLDPPIMQ
jgi:hypothetical protein